MKINILAVTLLFANVGFCDWFSIPVTTFPLVSISGANTTITFQANDPQTHPVLNRNTNSNVDIIQIVITPPAGKEKEWESIILTAISTGMDIRITGKYNNANGGTIYSGGTFPPDVGTPYLMLVPAGS
jgi:hypothetical protein